MFKYFVDVNVFIKVKVFIKFCNYIIMICKCDFNFMDITSFMLYMCYNFIDFTIKT